MEHVLIVPKTINAEKKVKLVRNQSNAALEICYSAMKEHANIDVK
jgi:hypothetical protein